MRANNPVRIGSASLYGGDALAIYDAWDAPTCIVSDGPYGLGKFPGEANTHDGLAEWYYPHVAEWTRRSSATTTLWFWNSELGWATVHPVLIANGWQYEECCVWDKGIAHVAGNCNSKTIRGVPVVTEVCVRYVRVATFETAKGNRLPIKEWVRAEWARSRLPMSRSNEACGVKNAATLEISDLMLALVFPSGGGNREHGRLLPHARSKNELAIFLTGRNKSSDRVRVGEDAIKVESCPRSNQCLARTTCSRCGTLSD